MSATQGKARQLTILTVPSHELDANVSLVTGLQATEKASRLCSWKFMTGNSDATPTSYSLTDPSPHATSSWFSLISDQARSYCASLVSNLFIRPSITFESAQPSPVQFSSFVSSTSSGLFSPMRLYYPPFLPRSSGIGAYAGRTVGSTYVFSTKMPCGPSPRQNRRPLPTMP